MPVTVTVAPASTRGSPPDSVSWVVADEGDGTVITVEGKLGHESAGAFAAALAALGAGGCDAIIDMARVEAIDAGALDGLVRVRRLFEILGLGLTVRAPSRQIEHRLGLFHLDDLIEAS
jgi:anti-anti-sigma regulatory factor